MNHMEPSTLALPPTPPYNHQQHPVDQTIQGAVPLFRSPAQKTRPPTHASAFHRVQPSMASMPSPPELVHDMEDEEDSTSLSSPPSPRVVVHATASADMFPAKRHVRKSTPHRSPPAIRDPLQASALDKSVVFQLDVRSHPFFPSHPSMHASHQSNVRSTNAVCPECYRQDCCGLACTSRIICGESVLTALRKRVIQARRRTTDGNPTQRRRMVMHRPKRTIRKPMHIEIPRTRSGAQRNRSPSPVDYERDEDPDLVDQDDQLEQQDQQDQLDQQDYHEPAALPALEQPPADHLQQSWHDEAAPAVDDETTSQAQPDKHVTSPSVSTRRSQPVLRTSATHASSGRPSRVKGPCQACQESSDGCMRKAFDWPFPADVIYNDKGRPFVHLCNKCGLRYNKSGGCVCRHCRWVFCKEEKRKAMQLIEQMRRSRPDGRVDPDEDIENFACSPKYWTCGRPWKVGWVLQNNNTHKDDGEDDATTD